MVEMYLGIDPGVVIFKALVLVIDDVYGQALTILILAFVKFPTKELHTHDGKNEPKHQADKQDIDNGGNGVHQGIDYDLKQVQVLGICTEISPSFFAHKVRLATWPCKFAARFSSQEKKNPLA